MDPLATDPADRPTLHRRAGIRSRGIRKTDPDAVTTDAMTFGADWEAGHDIDPRQWADAPLF